MAKRLSRQQKIDQAVIDLVNEMFRIAGHSVTYEDVKDRKRSSALLPVFEIPILGVIAIYFSPLFESQYSTSQLILSRHSRKYAWLPEVT
jgi:hypothetical protein